MSDVTALVLAAGQGKRMRSARPKVLHTLCGASFLEHVLAAVADAEVRDVAVVVGHAREDVERHLETLASRFGRLETAVQEQQLGTGHAVAAAADCLRSMPGDVVLILPGDVPLVRAATLCQLIAEHRAADRALTVLTAEIPDATGYGRVLRGEADELLGIVEHRDATPAQRQIREINTGIYAANKQLLLDVVARLEAENSQGEYYLTDAVELLRGEGRSVGACLAGEAGEVAGANDLLGLSELSGRLQDRVQRALMESGVTIVDPASTYIEVGVDIGADTTIHPFSVIRRGVSVGSGCEVGPFTHLRKGAELLDGAEVGNFVEVKNSTLGSHTKAKHLTYLGDTTIGARANIGAGTITANYDGKAKHRTEIEDGAFIGSGTILVAPVRVGEAGVTGAGAVVTSGRDVAPGDTVIGVPARSIQRAGAGGRSSGTGKDGGAGEA